MIIKEQSADVKHGHCIQCDTTSGKICESWSHDCRSISLQLALCSGENHVDTGLVALQDQFLFNSLFLITVLYQRRSVVDISYPLCNYIYISLRYIDLNYIYLYIYIYTISIILLFLCDNLNIYI